MQHFPVPGYLWAHVPIGVARATVKTRARSTKKSATAFGAAPIGGCLEKMYVQVKSNATNAASCTDSSGGYSVYLYTWPREWQGDRVGSFTFAPAHCTSDGKYCFEDQCTNPDSLGTFYLAGGNAILVDATVTTNGNPAPGTVVISTPHCPQG